MSFDWRDTLCGGVGSVCCVYAGLPFEVVKLRLQTQPTSYGGPLECFARILRGEGALALWKGATPAVASAMTENAIVFTANGIFRRAFLRFVWGRSRMPERCAGVKMIVELVSLRPGVGQLPVSHTCFCATQT